MGTKRQRDRCRGIPALAFDRRSRNCSISVARRDRCRGEPLDAVAADVRRRRGSLTGSWPFTSDSCPSRRSARRSRFRMANHAAGVDPEHGVERRIDDGLEDPPPAWGSASGRPRAPAIAIRLGESRRSHLPPFVTLRLEPLSPKLTEAGGGQSGQWLESEGSWERDNRAQRRSTLGSTCPPVPTSHGPSLGPRPAVRRRSHDVVPRAEWPEHARHVAVEFVHPVIVGKRALPAVASTAAIVGAVRPARPPGRCHLAIGPADGLVGAMLRRRRRGGSRACGSVRRRARWAARIT